MHHSKLEHFKVTLSPTRLLDQPNLCSCVDLKQRRVAANGCETSCMDARTSCPTGCQVTGVCLVPSDDEAQAEPSSEVKGGSTAQSSSRWRAGWQSPSQSHECEGVSTPSPSRTLPLIS
ncbi:hypothetical protein IE53DRAFT_388658 [Violaceomyces palustris]|uniref:Uncharacterized protein n=1 Tax=Violaceomyces palustris TaxID=1673888 RepID=A0ACD0NTU2_9BASI|nr:hypothetical protein IE53DRAFT_388658 [Violaceomyces palustris]